MAAYVKFNSFVGDMCNALVTLSSDTLRILLTNTAPAGTPSTDTAIDTTATPCAINPSGAVELAAQTGYVKKGTALTGVTSTASTGTYTLAANQVVFTAGAVWGAAFRYAVLFDDTAKTTATRPPIALWDYGSSVTLNNGETFTVQFNSASPGTIFTAT